MALSRPSISLDQLKEVAREAMVTALTPEGNKPTEKEKKKWVKRVDQYLKEWRREGYLVGPGPYKPAHLENVLAMLTAKVARLQGFRTTLWKWQSPRSIDGKIHALGKWIHMCRIMQEMIGEKTSEKAPVTEAIAVSVVGEAEGGTGNPHPYAPPRPVVVAGGKVRHTAA